MSVNWAMTSGHALQMVLHPEASNTNALVRVIIEYLSVRIPFVKGPPVSLIKSVEIFLLSSEKAFWGIQWTFTCKSYCYTSGLELGWGFKWSMNRNRIEKKKQRCSLDNVRAVYNNNKSTERTKFTAVISCSDSLDLNEFLSFYSNLTRSPGQILLKASRISSHTTEDLLD